MNDRFDPEGAEGVYFTREPELFTIEIRDCDVDSKYAAEIARGTEVAQAEFGEIWAEHGERSSRRPRPPSTSWTSSVWPTIH